MIHNVSQHNISFRSSEMGKLLVRVMSMCRSVIYLFDLCICLQYHYHYLYLRPSLHPSSSSWLYVYNSASMDSVTMPSGHLITFHQALHLLGDVSWQRLKSPSKPYNPAQLWFSKASTSPRTEVSKIYTWKNATKYRFWPLNLKKIESASMFHWDMPCHALPVGKRLQPSQPWHRKGWLQPNYLLYMLPGIKGNNETSKVNFPSPSFT